MTLALYPSILGNNWKQLAAQIQTIHQQRPVTILRGEMTIRHGNSMLSKIVNKIIGLPLAGNNVPTCVTLTQTDQGEHWHRVFSKHVFATFQYRQQPWLVEKMGLLRLFYHVSVENESLHLQLMNCYFLSIRLPKFLSPDITATESIIKGKFTVKVQVSLPFNQLLIEYFGTLSIEDNTK